MAGLTVRTVGPHDLERYHAGIVDAYAEVFAEPPWNENEQQFAAFGESLYDHAASSGFRCAVAVDPEHVVHGFTLGADWESGHWWCSRVEQDLGPRAPVWTLDCFHLMELAVRRAYRGSGYGGRLYDELVGGIPHGTAILSTNRLGPVAAATLYARRGWKLLLEEWRHCADCELVQVLGLRDPALSARVAR